MLASSLLQLRLARSPWSGRREAHPCKVALADLQHALEADFEHALRIFDHLGIDASGTLLDLAVRLRALCLR